MTNRRLGDIYGFNNEEVVFEKDTIRNKCIKIFCSKNILICFTVNLGLWILG